MWVLFELFYKSSYIGKWILITWLDLSVAGQKENFKIDVMVLFLLLLLQAIFLRFIFF